MEDYWIEKGGGEGEETEILQIRIKSFAFVIVGR